MTQTTALVPTLIQASELLAGVPVSKPEIDALIAHADAINVTDNASMQAALEVVQRLKGQQKAIESWAKPSQDQINALHKGFIAGLKAWTDPIAARITSLTRGVLGYEAAVKAENERLKREAEEKARKEREEAERLAKEAEEDAAPWEDTPVVPVPMVSVATMVVPQIATPVVSGIATANTPYKCVIKDAKALLLWILADAERMAEWIEVDPENNVIRVRPAVMTQKARSMKSDLEKFVPGLAAIQERTLRSR